MKMFLMHGRQAGRAIVSERVRDFALSRGMHTHTHSHDGGERCDGGDSECPLWNAQLARLISSQ